MQHSLAARRAADAADILSRFGSWIGWVFPPLSSSGRNLTQIKDLALFSFLFFK